MNLTIRNQIPATVISVTRGGVMATVKARLAGGQTVTASVTVEAVDDLGIAEGSTVTVLAKSTEVALALGEVHGLSIRNQIPGVVTQVDLGAVMATAKIAIDGSGLLTAAITKDAAVELGLSADSHVTALIKSTELSLASV